MIGSLRASVLGAVKLTRIWLAGAHESRFESLPRVNKGGAEQEHSELRGLRRRLLTTGNTAVQSIWQRRPEGCSAAPERRRLPRRQLWTATARLSLLSTELNRMSSTANLRNWHSIGRFGWKQDAGSQRRPDFGKRLSMVRLE